MIHKQVGLIVFQKDLFTKTGSWPLGQSLLTPILIYLLSSKIYSPILEVPFASFFPQICYYISNSLL